MKPPPAYGHRAYNGETLAELRAAGYQRISRRYRVVARIDVPPEEYERLIRKELRIDKKTPLSEDHAGHYRRIYSADKIEGVPEHIFFALPTSR